MVFGSGWAGGRTTRKGARPWEMLGVSWRKRNTPVTQRSLGSWMVTNPSNLRCCSRLGRTTLKVGLDSFLWYLESWWYFDNLPLQGAVKIYYKTISYLNFSSAVSQFIAKSSNSGMSSTSTPECITISPISINRNCVGQLIRYRVYSAAY